jgi:hypothetical protein
LAGRGKWWLLVGLVAALLGIVAIGAAGFGLWYARQPHILNANGPTPRLQFEVEPPNGQSVEALANIEAELDTDRNVMPAYWDTSTSANQNYGVRAGSVELYFRTSRGLLVLKFPNGEDRLFKPRLPANPMQPKYRQWSDWQMPDYIARPNSQPSRQSGGADCQIRYRVDYQER